MTKSQQIMALYDGKRTTREIADLVGCKPEYVRVVARQRKGGGLSEIDHRYRETERGRAAIGRSNLKRRPQLVASLHAHNKVVRATGSRDAARQAARTARDAARLQGKNPYEAYDIYRRVYWRIMRQTSDLKKAKAASRRAYHAVVHICTTEESSTAPVLEAAE